jgi:hypothetical protein
MFGYKPLSATGGDVALDTAIDVEDDVDDSEGLAMACVVDVGEGVACVVAVLGVIVALTLVGGEAGGEDGENCPLRMSSNDGGTILTVAHCCLNQTEVDSKSAPSQVREMQWTASTKNPLPGSHTQVHYSSASNKSCMTYLNSNVV